MPPTSRLIVFAKAPRPGFAKTRLAPLLGSDGAAALHAKLIEHTLKIAVHAACGGIDLYGDPAGDEFLRACAERHRARLMQQAAGALGERMRAALEHALSRDPFAILVGTDCPALTAKHLGSAMRALEDGNDAVFIPAEDGGYALIGLARCDQRLFEGIPWSTSEVMALTRGRLAKLRWKWVELETLWDVDTPSDYERLVASGILESTAPAT